MTSYGHAQRTLTVVKKIASPWLWISFVTLFVSSQAQAQGNATTKNSSKLSQKLQKPESDFSVSGSMIQSKPFREEQNQLSLISLAGEYKFEDSLKNSSSIELALDYVYVWTEYKESTQSQLDAATISFNRDSHFSSNLILKYGTEISVPANSTDSTAGFNGAVGIPLGLIWKFWNQDLSLGVVPTFYSYKYKTATEGGEEYNKKISGLARLQLTSKFSHGFKWKNTVRLFEYQNYAGSTYQIYSFASYLRFSPTDSITLLAGIESKDRVITTNSVLADDVTSARAGVEWSY